MGLDPQELYAQNHEASRNNRHWDWNPREVVPPSQEYRDKFMKRHKQLIDEYEPEIIYYDDTVVPFWPTFNDGVELTAYYYNTMLKKNHGKQEVVACGKILNEQQRKGMVWDVERGVPGGMIFPYWQTDTCIGSWHYDRGIYDRNGYKSADTVVRMLIDIVSKGASIIRAGGSSHLPMFIATLGSRIDAAVTSRITMFSGESRASPYSAYTLRTAPCARTFSTRKPSMRVTRCSRGGYFFHW